MLDQLWLKSLIEAARERLWRGSAAGVDVRSLRVDAGLREPRNELERLVLLGLVADLHIKAVEQHDPDHRLDAVVACIRASYRTAPLSRSAVARATGLSESWIAHRCRQRLGASFSEIVTQHRLNDAAKLLASTNASVKEIALTVGYTSTATFTRAFVRHFGLPPTNWRAKHHAGA